MRVITAIGKAGAAAIVTAILLAAPKPARAGRLGTDVIALFPKNIGEFAYADLKKARSQKWFPQLQEQMIPEKFKQFEKFLASAGVDPNSQVDELAWGLVAEGLLTNDQIFPLINEANGNGVVWAVLNPAYTRLAMQQLAPEVEQFPEAAKLVARMQNLIINVDASSGIDGKFQAVCGSVEDANTLGQLLQAGFLYKRYQAQKENPELADLLDQARITPAGDRVALSMSLSDEQMTALIRRNTFALKM